MRRRIAAALAAALVSGGVPRAGAHEVVRYKPMPGIVPAPATVFGLYRGSDFQLTRGTCKGCAAPRQALWYFRDEVLALPSNGVEVAGFTRGVGAQDDVRRWYATAGERELRARPPLLWIGATHRARDVRLTGADELQFSDGRKVPFQVVPKLATNRSYFDDSSKAYLRRRPLRVRGELRGQTFTARTLWPQDWAIDEKRLHPLPLLPDETLMRLVRRHENARSETYEARLLWERTPAATPGARNWAGQAVLALILNGAQGDDDEAHGGHFAVATGRHAADGGMADWIVNNFYNLDTTSEKGIIAAMLPLDNYLTDLNSGQSWYRPSYLLVAVLRNERAAHAYQAAIARVYHHFYRHDFRYDHAAANCTGISMDTLRTLGWSIPLVGSSGWLRAIAAYPYQALAGGSFAAGKAAYDYLMQEQSRLYPAAAYEAAGRDLLRIAREGTAAAGTTEKALGKLLRDDLQALVFVRIPQIPSSRAFGSYPVSGFDEYLQRVPARKSEWKIVPVDARPLPAELLQPDALHETRSPPWLTLLYGALALAGAAIAGALGVRHLRRSHHGT